MRFSIRIRYLLFLCFTLLSIVPVTILAIWVQHSAMDREVSAIQEKHLLVARNLTNSLERYVADTESVFKMVTRNIVEGQKMEGARNLLKSLHFKHVCITDGQGRVDKYISVNPETKLSQLPKRITRSLFNKASKDEVTFSEVLADGEGDPTIFLVEALPNEQFAIGALGTDYPNFLQNKITFGERGHAAIVDQLGQIIAHPNEIWRKEMKNISKVGPVSNMMQGESGVSFFFSPAVKADMVAGYTAVSKVGWGVMVPQPIKELEEKAARIQLVALQIVIVGAIIALLLSWWLAGYLAKPVQTIATAAKALSKDKLDTRVNGLPRFVPRELRSLASTFNTMITRVEERVATRTKELSESNRLLQQEIGERKHAERHIEYLAYHDPLTGLANRRLFLEHLQQALKVSQRHRTLGALLFLDLDRFKTLNDAAGHPVGDALLVEAAKRLAAVCRVADVVARLGGDEFVILLSRLNTDFDEASNAAKLVAQKIQQSLSAPYQIGGHDHRITVSIGIAVFPETAETSTEILNGADTAMYRAKFEGRNTICFYEPKMKAAINKRLGLEKDLGQALQNGEFYLKFQPQVDISTGQVVGAEALLRWRHPQEKIVPPDEFIPVAEETGLILEIGEFVLEEACSIFSSWIKSGIATHLKRISVNVSPKQFHNLGFENQIKQILKKNDVDPNRLELELTEHVLIANIEETISRMQTLRELGFRFSIDDFGTGYSSLTYLKRLPLDNIKMDRSFVKDIAIGSNDVVIVETIISMASSLNLEIIPEGVETQYQANFLRRKGCRILQGNYFGEPVDADEFACMLSNQDYGQRMIV